MSALSFNKDFSWYFPPLILFKVKSKWLVMFKVKKNAFEQDLVHIQSSYIYENKFQNLMLHLKAFCIFDGVPVFDG